MQDNLNYNSAKHQWHFTYQIKWEAIIYIYTNERIQCLLTLQNFRNIDFLKWIFILATIIVICSPSQLNFCSIRFVITACIILFTAFLYVRHPFEATAIAYKQYFNYWQHNRTKQTDNFSCLQRIQKMMQWAWIKYSALRNRRHKCVKWHNNYIRTDCTSSVILTLESCK